MITPNGYVPTCARPDCPSPAFRGEEKDPTGHVHIPGTGHFHFGCYWKLRQAALVEAGLVAKKGAGA